MSLAQAIPWSEPPFRQRVGRCRADGFAADALAAVGLPPLRADAHPLAKALALAALLRSVPWQGERETLGARLLPPPALCAAFVGIYRGEIYRTACDGQWEPLFADGGNDCRAIGPREVELAEGHLRMVDTCTVKFDGGGDAAA